MMEMALAASSDPELAERLLSRIWQSIQVMEKNILPKSGKKLFCWKPLWSENTPGKIYVLRTGAGEDPSEDRRRRAGL